MSATVIGEGETQRRSYPSYRGQYGTRGWELVTELDLPAHAARIADEARALLSAPVCPAGVTTLILGSEQMALQIHESVGHAIELDRILGWEAAFAGTSWLDRAQLGSLRYGSDLMNIVIDPTIPGGLGSFGFDDEGTPAASRHAVRDGLWVGVLAGRDSAAVAGLDYAGSVRADGWARLPMVRMTNVGLQPGPHSLSEMIAATDDGVMMDLNRSWSIDDKRLNFHSAARSVGDQERQARPDAEEPDVHRHRPAVLAVDGHARLRGDHLGHAELRQGSAGPDRPYGPSRGRGALHRRSGGGEGMSGTGRSEHGERPR